MIVTISTAIMYIKSCFKSTFDHCQAKQKESVSEFVKNKKARTEAITIDG